MQGHEITLHSEQGWLDSKAENKFRMKFNAFHKLCRRDPFYSPQLQLSFMKTSNDAAYLIHLWSTFSALHFVIARNAARDSSALAFSFGLRIVRVVGQLAGPHW